MILKITPEPDDRAITDSELWAEAEGSGIGPRVATEPPPRPRSAASLPWSLRGGSNGRAAALVCLLMHTARALAASQITISNGLEQISICAACGERTPAGIPARHRPSCLSAEVASIVARLRESLELNPQRKEEIAGTLAGADGRNHPRPNYGEPWVAGPVLDSYLVVDLNGATRACVTGTNLAATAERIAACVNFCAGKSSEFLIRAGAGAESEER